MAHLRSLAASLLAVSLLGGTAFAQSRISGDQTTISRDASGNQEWDADTQASDGPETQLTPAGKLQVKGCTEIGGLDGAGVCKCADAAQKRTWTDKDCDGVKEAGEDYDDEAAGAQVSITTGSALDAVYGFGRVATGGRDGTRVVVDTTTWIGPDGDGGTFDASDCDAVGGDACNFAEAVCRGNAYITFSVSGGITVTDTRSNDGTDSGHFELADCATPPDNFTLDFETAPGAGVYLQGMDFTLDGPSTGTASNVVLKGFRHRGSDDGAVSLSAGLAMAGCERCSIKNYSIAYPMTYLVFVGDNLFGHNLERNRDVTFQGGLLAWSHVLGEWQGASQTDTPVGAGTCSNNGARACCIDGDNAGTLFPYECETTGTCTGESATCRIRNTDGKVFSLLGASTSPNAGATCQDDWDAQYGQCHAYCEGYGADANKRAAHEGEHGGFKRQYNSAEGICEGGSSPGIPCSSTCPGGGTCRKECGAGTYATGPFHTSGMDNYGPFVSGNIANISWLRHLVMGHRWRCPNYGPDTSTGDSASTADEAMAAGHDVAQNWCFGGRWMVDSWTEYSERDQSIVFSHNRHENNASTNLLFADFWGPSGYPLANTNGSTGCFVTPGGGNTCVGPDTKMFFNDNLDLHHSVGSELCDSGVCGTEDAYSWSNSDTAAGGTGIAGQDGDIAQGFYGERGPLSTVPTWPGSFAALRALIRDESGALLPCRDAVDRYAAQLFDAGIALRVLHSRDEVGGVQQDMSVCPDVVTDWTPSAQSKTGGSAVNVTAGTGINSTTATVSTTETRMLKLHAWIQDDGQVNARIRDPRVSAGTATFDFDVGSGGSSLPAGCYPFTYNLSIGDYPKRAVGTIEVDVGGSSC